MRLLGRGLILLLLFIVLMWGWGQIQVWQWPSWLENRGLTNNRLAEARPSSVYLLDDTEWIEFAVTGMGEQVKVLSNANISLALAQKQDSQKVLPYALEYQVVDGKGETVEQRVYNQRSRVTFYRDTLSSDELLIRKFYLGTDLVPADSVLLRINVAEVQRPLTVRLRLASADPQLADVAVRVYQPNPVPEHRLATAWQRLNVKTQDHIARGSVHPADILREHEISNLLRHLSQPVGPKGIRGQDYRDRTLYSINQYDDDWQEDNDELVLPAGLYADAWLRATLIIPQEGARMALSFQAAARALGADEKVVVRWYGHEIGQRSEEVIDIVSNGAQVERTYNGGLLEIIASAPLLIQGQFLDQVPPQELDGNAFNLRGYLAEDEQAVEYRIDHVQHTESPFRVDLRAFSGLPIQDTSWPPARYVRYQWLADDGQVIDEGRLMLNPNWSIYDRFTGDTSGLRLSEPASYYFALPPNVAKVRFYADSAALIVAYSRPLDLMRHIRVPEDYYIADEDDNRQLPWFLVRPVDDYEMVAANRSVVLTIQRRPPEDNADILAGRYDWKSIEPKNPWLARYLLVPRDPEAVLREEALASVYQVVAAGASVGLDFRGEAKIPQVNPTLLFLRDDGALMNVEIILDSDTVFKGQVVGRRGELPLPPVLVGHHTITIKADGIARWLVNYAGVGSEAYLKRLVHRIPHSTSMDNVNSADCTSLEYRNSRTSRLGVVSSTNPELFTSSDASLNRPHGIATVQHGSDCGLEFLYEKKSDEEVLSAQIFLPLEDDQRSQVHVSLAMAGERGNGPYTNWTFTHRLNDIKPSQMKAVVVLNTLNEFVGEPRRLFVPLGNDLPKGWYRIRFDHLSGPAGYVVLYKLTPGVFDRRSFFIERLLSDALVNP